MNDNTNNSISPAVNFYILSDSDLDNRLMFVYRLVEKAYDQKLNTLVVAADEEQLKILDKLIWSAKPERFIPHEIISDSLEKPFAPILLTDTIDNSNCVDCDFEVVIDLSYDAQPLNFPKVMLIANQYADVLANARMKYQSYVNIGVKPTVHKLTF
ncbi:MAG: DNA polymerase III subunit chi [Gammaproteobacteria bacterium]|nr:DNA polymerase III subunit chi [Gammaproteobacteria bacterium]